MEFQEIVRRRRMVRDYDGTPVDAAVVDRALANAVRAPSAGFSQGWAFLVLDEPGDVRRFWAAADGADSPDVRPDAWLTGMMRAPVVIVPCSSRAVYLRRYAETDKRHVGGDPGAPGESPWSVPFWHLDTAMASLLVLQTAVDEGLGGCFFGIPPAREGAVREAFGIPADHDPIGALTLGHPAPTESRSGSPRTRRRRSQSEVVHRGRWGR